MLVDAADAAAGGSIVGAGGEAAAAIGAVGAVKAKVTAGGKYESASAADVVGCGVGTAVDGPESEVSSLSSPSGCWSILPSSMSKRPMPMTTW